jgi:tetratricopeptide (TPR) repeat protein
MNTRPSFLFCICMLTVIPLAELSANAGGSAAAEPLFFQANVYYAGEQYDQAITYYLQALQVHPTAHIHYNLGNAYYKTGNSGLARLHWERALVMNPGHASARLHRESLLAELRVDDYNAGFWHGFIVRLSFNQWLILTVLAFWSLAFLWLLKRFFKANWSVLLIAPCALLLLLGLSALWLLSAQLNKAIITSSEASLRIAPTPDSPITQTLAEAQSLSIGTQYGDFFRVTLQNGSEGFLHREHWQAIRKHNQ